MRVLLQTILLLLCQRLPLHRGPGIIYQMTYSGDVVFSHLRGPLWLLLVVDVVLLSPVDFLSAQGFAKVHIYGGGVALFALRRVVVVRTDGGESLLVQALSVALCQEQQGNGCKAMALSSSVGVGIAIRKSAFLIMYGLRIDGVDGEQGAEH